MSYLAQVGNQEHINQMILNQGVEFRQTINGLEQNSKYFKAPDTFQSNNGALFSLFEPFVEGAEVGADAVVEEAPTGYATSDDDTSDDTPTGYATSDDDTSDDTPTGDATSDDTPTVDCPFDDDSLCNPLQDSTPKLVIADASDEVAKLVSEYNTLLANYIILYSKIHTDKANYDDYFKDMTDIMSIYAVEGEATIIGNILHTGYLIQENTAADYGGDDPVYLEDSNNSASGEIVGSSEPHPCKTFSNILYGSKLITSAPDNFWFDLNTNLNGYVKVIEHDAVYYIDKMGVANDVTENTNIVVPPEAPSVLQTFIETCAKRIAPGSSDVSLNTYTDIIISTEIFDIDEYLTIITTNSKLQTKMIEIIAQMESDLLASQVARAASEANASEASTSEAGTCTYPFNNCTPSGCVAGKCPKMGADCDYICTSSMKTCCCYDSQCTGTGTGTGTGGSNIQHHQQQLQHDHNMLQDINNSVTTLQQQNTNSELTFNKSRYVYILWVILAIIVAIVIFKKL
jgi:hypothetical protein